ncbi:MAG: threonine synthase [Planctomycetes bacterium]|nr:threonine synthase [Planctomycetota bacterium]
MSYVTRLTCVCCDREFAEGEATTCPGCGPDEGILDVHYDLPSVATSLTRDALARRSLSHWRYRELLPLDEAFCPTSGTIGWTPMIEAPRLAEALGIGRLRLKDEGRSPSGSFKDRASSVGVARAMQEGQRTLACASTGNAASSLAYCTAAAGLETNIFVSQAVPDGKLAQLLAYGARVFKIQGSYAQAYELCTRACERFGWYNRNAAINPYLVEGKKTGGLEVAEQCVDDPPDWVVCSVGDGCSIAGVHKGLAQMRAIGLIDWQARMLGVQAAGVDAIARAYETGDLDRSGAGYTYADSINVPVPRNWRKAVNAVRDSNGAFATVTDEQIMEAVRQSGRLAGVFAEPAAAAAVAGIAGARHDGLLNPQSSVVAMITGNGLKDIDGAMRAVGRPHEISPDLDQVERIVESDPSS